MYNIIGAGLCGSFVAKEFQNNNIKFRVFDSRELFASSKISENLFSPTWLKGVEYLPKSIKWLRSNYNVRLKEFNTNKSTQKVYHIPVNEILYKDVIQKKVTKVTDQGLYCGNEFFEGVNIICAGFFAKDLVEVPDLNSLTGHGLLFEANENNVKLPETMRHYRPFTHEKIMKWFDGHIWYGDSTTIRHERYLKEKKEFIKATLIRAKKIGLSGKYLLQYGARPFINNKDKKYGYYKKINKNNFVLTGGWKDGLVIYPYLVTKLMNDIK